MGDSFFGEETVSLKMGGYFCDEDTRFLPDSYVVTERHELGRPDGCTIFYFNFNIFQNHNIQE